jgi:hypothetical protein
LVVLHDAFHASFCPFSAAVLRRIQSTPNKKKDYRKENDKKRMAKSQKVAL